jgi:hypothetical protein
MAIDVPTFLASFPEFKDAGTPLIQATLNRALLFVPISTWRVDFQQEGAFLYCARFLSLTPWGRKMNLANKSGETNYDRELQRVKNIVTAGLRFT